MKPRAVCTVAVSALRRRPMLGVAVGVGALAALRQTLPGAGVHLNSIQLVTPLLHPARALNGLSHYRSQSTLSGLFSLSPADSIMASLNPPQAAPKWTHTPEDVLKLTEDAIAEYRALEDRVAALKPEECNFESVGAARRLCSAASLISLLGIRKSPVSIGALCANRRSHHGRS